jgi:CheY-like chemotaxis protein
VRDPRRLEHSGTSSSASSSPSSSPPQRARHEDLLSPNQAGRELGVSGVAVKQWIYQRKLPARKLSNGYWRIRRADLEQFLRERDKGGTNRVLTVGHAAEEARRAFEAAGWHTLTARNPVDAVLRALDVRPSVVLIDVGSLGEGGWVAAKKLRSKRGTQRVPMILLIPDDAHSDSTTMDRAVALGAQACLASSSAPSVLVATAHELLGMA